LPLAPDVPYTGGVTAPTPHVDVCTPDGQVYHLIGRAARWVLWLCLHMDKVNRLERGELVLGFRGELGTYRLTEAGEM